MPEPCLIVQTGFLGDAVLASGMIRSIAAARPGAEIGIVVRRDAAELFAGHPALARVHAFDKRSEGGTAAMIEELRRSRYGVAFLPHRSFRSALMARRAGIGRRIGFRQSDAPWLLTDRIEYDISLHETARNAALLRPEGIEPVPAMQLPWLEPQAEHLESMRLRFDDGRPIALLAPGSVWSTKQWTKEGFADTARELAGRGWRVLLTGGPGDAERCSWIAERAGIDSRDVAAGTLSLGELLALTALARRVIANDSAPVHLAGSVGTPVTAIFGPTVPEIGFGPLGPSASVVQVEDLPCRPCRIHGSGRCPIGTHECMERIAARDVLDTIVNDGEQRSSRTGA